ncbi:hypothetical protein HYV85_01245 [Candidatus Woesearchaeota archaeon]|nr:hypothetical protein [Candidatus Woesearchaeota archaeon]
MKKPVVLASAGLKGHSMHRNSGLALYWLTLLALVVLNMLATISAAVVQFAIGGQKALFFVAAMGLFFGYVTYRLVSLIDNLEPRHHFFAWLLVPAAAMVNLFIISAAANNLSSAIGIGYRYNPLLVSLSYGVSFMMPLLASFASRAFTVSSSSNNSRKIGRNRRKNRLGRLS